MQRLSSDMRRIAGLLSRCGPKNFYLLVSERSLGDLEAHTPGSVRGRAKEIIPMMQTVTRDGRYIYKTVTLDNGHTHHCWVMPVPSEDKKALKSTSQDVLVWCDCPYFMYTLEVSLAKTNASVVAQSNGDDPVITNPGMRKYLCKHLYSVLRDIRKRI